MPADTTPPPAAAGRRPIILSDRTLTDGSSVAHIEIAAELGYDGVALRVAPTLDGRPYLRPGGDGIAQARRALQRTGVQAHQVETARIGPETTLADFRPLLDAGAELGAPFLLTIIDDADEARAVDSFAALTEAARRHGIRVALEFMAYIGVGSLAAALRVLERAGAHDAALLIDAMHFFRSGAEPEELAGISPSRFAFCQICDGARVSPKDLREEARHHRLMPGRGELPLVRLVRALPPTCGMSVEAPNAALLAELGDRGVAALALETTRSLLASAA